MDHTPVTNSYLTFPIPLQYIQTVWSTVQAIPMIAFAGKLHRFPSLCHFFEPPQTGQKIVPSLSASKSMVLMLVRVEHICGIDYIDRTIVVVVGTK